MRLFLIIIAFLFNTFPALAQSPPGVINTPKFTCGNRADIIKRLSDKFQETPISLGISSTGSVMEILTATSGTWTVIMNNPNRVSCIVAFGTAWKILK